MSKILLEITKNSLPDVEISASDSGVRHIHIYYEHSQYVDDWYTFHYKKRVGYNFLEIAEDWYDDNSEVVEMVINGSTEFTMYDMLEWFGYLDM